MIAASSVVIDSKELKLTNLHTAKSKKVALLIGRLSIWNNEMIYFSDHEAIAFQCAIPNSQCPIQPLLNQLYTATSFMG